MDGVKKEETDTKKHSKGRKGRSNNQREQNEKEKNKSTVKSEEETEADTPPTIEQPKNLKQKILKWMDHSAYVATMIILTVLALFMVDMVIAVTVLFSFHKSFSLKVEHI
jgi:hypothetical protein